jgi:small redox-active disulfide protein 2
MKEIKILGTGCPKCEELAKRADAAAQSSGIEYTLEKVKEINDILAAGVMITPALMVDGEVKVAGKVPTEATIKEYLV